MAWTLPLYPGHVCRRIVDQRSYVPICFVTIKLCAGVIALLSAGAAQYWQFQTTCLLRNQREVAYVLLCMGRYAESCVGVTQQSELIFQCHMFRLRIVRLNNRQEVDIATGLSDCLGVHHVVVFRLRWYPL